MAPTIVVASSHPSFVDDRILDAVAMDALPGGALMSGIVRAARKVGMRVTTLDRIGDVAEPHLVVDLGSPPLSPLPQRARRTVAFCLESPLIAHRLYHDLRRVVDQYDHAFCFPGAGELLAGSSTIFHPLRWPNARTAVDETVPWDARRFAAMVNSNKRAHLWRPGQLDVRHPRQSARVAWSAVLARAYRRTDPWMRKDLYVDRLELMRHLSNRADFDLYGLGWERPVPGDDGRYAPAVRRAYRGAIDDKHATLVNYRFAVCFENTAWDGYVTEKIFDGLLAGAIPIYLGAPDIAELVPREAFVDAREFSDLHELEQHLRTMDTDEVDAHLAAARAFVDSPAFTVFSGDRLGREVVAAIASVAAGGR